MGWTLTTYTLVVFASAVVATAVGLIALRQRPDPLAWPLAITMFAVTAWAIPNAISFGYTDLEPVLFWQRMRYPGTVLAPIAYLVLVLKYAGYDQWLSRNVYAGLTIIPSITVLVVWTNPLHGLFWQSVSVVQIGNASVLVETFGPWYWINLSYLYLATLASLILLALVMFRSGPLYRKQASLMFIGGGVPLFSNIAINFGIMPDPTVDFTTTALAVSGLTFAFALFHLDLLEIQPVARDLLIDELDDGMVVVGPNGRIRDFNPTAARILGDLTIDQPAEEVLPSDVAPDGGELVVEMDGRDRMYRTRSTTLTDSRGQDVGRIVYLNDVTELATRDQRISVLNRILRHNIRNELNVVDGRLQILGDHVDAEAFEHVETARRSTQRVIDFAEKARYIEQTLRRSDVTETASADRVIERVMSDARARYPDAGFEYTATSESDAAVRVIDDDLFEMAIAELVENAVIHNDHESPQVTVRIEPHAAQVRVSVADNGPGIPKAETDVLTSRTETHLTHSSGLGLWLVKWFVSLSSGELSFEEQEPRGSIVSLTLPADTE